MTAWVLVMGFLVHGGYAPLTVSNIASSADCEALATKITAEWTALGSNRATPSDARRISGHTCYEYRIADPALKDSLR